MPFASLQHQTFNMAQVMVHNDQTEPNAQKHGFVNLSTDSFYYKQNIF